MAAVVKGEKKAKVVKQKEKPGYAQAQDPWSILAYPLLTEKCIAGIERDNKLVFIVDRHASKKQIRWAIEKALSVKVAQINTHIDREGRKKALIKLKPEFRAADIATRFGML
jgi:large subunit ribosomal protein L23